MSTPDWLLEIFAGVTLWVAAMSAGHLAVARAWIHRGAVDADIVLFHLLLGIAMAGLLATDLNTLPNAAWDIVFAVTTAWFDWCLWRESRKYGAAAAVNGQYAPQLAYSAAMLYLFTAIAKPSAGGSVMSGMSGMPGMGDGSSGVMPPLRVPTLALVFTVLLVALTVRDVDRPASADGYFHIAGRWSISTGPTLVDVAAGSAFGATPVLTLAPAYPAQTHAGAALQSGRARRTAELLLLAPAAVKGRRVTLGVTIAFMLIVMM
jgi:hypothetical protein